ncbi:hypothetical protein J3459_010243 [Metarhizium acridum]|nr:hypothetical protein J3459_010243 [Metarhizium acridum]
MKRSIFFRKLITLMDLLGNTPPRFAPVLTFGIALLSFGPLSWLTYSLPTLISSFTRFTSLQDFITTCEDSRVCYSDAVTPGELNGSGPGTGPGAVAPFGFLGDALIAPKDASTIFKTNDEAVLRDINLFIQPGSFTLVAGKVGSGKSALLRGLLGQLQTTGYLKVHGAGAAYCAQTPWLMNATVRSNILGQSVMDKDWYRTVVSACALDRDLAQLPNDDMSFIGTNGLSSSGGQKQRISLARALYSRKPVVVLDDVLSGLDWITQRHVYNRVLAPKGLLRGSKTTVILATRACRASEFPNFSF